MRPGGGCILPNAIKISFLTRSLELGGAERQLVALARRLHEGGHDISVAVLYPGGPLEKELREAGIETHPLDKKGRWDFLGFLLRLVRFVREEGPEVLHGYVGGPNILAALLKPLFPRVHIVWGLRASRRDFDSYDGFVRLSLQVERLLSRFADLIVVNSNAGWDAAAAYGFPKSKMAVIPNGIDTDRFRPDPESRRRVRSQWGVEEDERLIGLVGRLAPVKDHRTFLAAAALLSREHSNVRFVCVGDGPAGYWRELHALSDSLGLSSRLIWAGARTDMPAVYNALDVATSTSTSEGFPNVVGEAMSCGIPCVVTDVGDSAWIVGESGEVVPPRDPGSLAAGWATALGKQSGYDPRQRIVKEFGLEALYERTILALSRL